MDDGEFTNLHEGSFRAHRHAIEASLTIGACRDLLALVKSAASTIEGGGKIITFGNGGSAAQAQHLAAELTVRFRGDRQPIPAISLSADSVALTAALNDFGPDHVFARQLAAIASVNDMAVGLSTSGKSRNIRDALRLAGKMGMSTVLFTGMGGARPDLGLVQHTIAVPSADVAVIQEVHLLLCHIFCAALETELGYT